MRRRRRAHLLAVDGFASRAVMVGEVAALAHERRDHAVEGALLVAKARLARAQLPEILRPRASGAAKTKPRSTVR